MIGALGTEIALGVLTFRGRPFPVAVSASRPLKFGAERSVLHRIRLIAGTYEEHLIRVNTEASRQDGVCGSRLRHRHGVEMIEDGPLRRLL